MSGRVRGVAIALVGALLAGGGLVGLRAGEPSPGSRELLYLPNGEHLKIASLGHAPLIADIVYLWAIQYYATYREEDRYRYVEHVFGTVIPALDPRYVDAYALGCLILAVEARDLDGALRVVDRGIEENPDAWVLPYLGAWECYRAGRHEQAAKYFAMAAAVPEAPARIRRNRAGTVARGGDLREAYALWAEIRDDPQSDEAAVRIATSRMRDLHERIDLRELTRAVEAFAARHRRNPADLEALVRAGSLARMPVDPDGRPYVYDAATGIVETAGGRRHEP